MQFVMSVLDFALRLDVHLKGLALDYGTWAYVILFVLVFCETGLVVTPFLPGDSVLFMLGALTASGILEFLPAALLLMAAAILGDTVNYGIGKFVGPRAFRKDDARFFNKDNLVKAQAFYGKWGGLAILLGRFMPIIRTFVPFVAGIGRMRYGKFLAFNAMGGILWVSLFMGCGYFFGDIPFIKRNLTALVLLIILVSFIPVIVGAVNSRRARKA
jgi:membrane-associated protein